MNGNSLGLDGAWKIRNIATTTMVLEPVGTTVAPTNFTITNAGGAIIKRTDVRIPFIRIFDYERQRVEVLSRPASDAMGSVPVSVKSMPPVTMTSTTIAGTTAVDAAIPNPVAIGGRASNANIAAMSATGDLVAQLMTMIGVSIFKPYSLPEADWTNSIVLTTNTDTSLKAAAGAGIKNYLTALQVQNTHATVETTLIIKDGTTARFTINLPANMSAPVPIIFPSPIQTAANAVLNVACGTTGSNVLVNAQGYFAP